MVTGVHWKVSEGVSNLRETGKVGGAMLHQILISVLLSHRIQPQQTYKAAFDYESNHKGTKKKKERMREDSRMDLRVMYGSFVFNVSWGLNSYFFWQQQTMMFTAMLNYKIIIKIILHKKSIRFKFDDFY